MCTRFLNYDRLARIAISPLQGYSSCWGYTCPGLRVHRSALSRVFQELPFIGREPRCEPEGPETTQGQPVEHAVATHNVIFQREGEHRRSDRWRDRTLYGCDSLSEAVHRSEHTAWSCR